jgi:Competence protein CoiA-like family
VALNISVDSFAALKPINDSREMPNLLYTVATGKNGNLTKANDAEKGGDFFCPVCKTELILKKSGRTGKGTRRPHFAHRALTPNCTPETALHYSFKTLLAEKLQRNITSHIPLPIAWLCQYCYTEHSGNLLKKIKSVRVEHDMTVCQPDIALFDNEDNVFAVVEVVVTHKPEKSVVAYYDEENIILIQINLKSDQDIDELENKIAKPDLVTTCLNPKCKVCRHFQDKTTMMIVDGPCWKCRSTMKTAIVVAGNWRSGSHVGPEEFTKQELDFARNKGVILKTRYNKFSRTRSLANTCGNCGTFAEDYRYSFVTMCFDTNYRSTNFEIGHYCSHCAEVLNSVISEQC